VEFWVGRESFALSEAANTEFAAKKKLAARIIARDG
jgi:hypothetical protein